MSIYQNHCIQTLFERQAKTTPKQIAVIIGAETITYEELNSRANQFADYLEKDRAVSPGDVVAIHIPNSIQLIIVLLGTLKAGATYLPLDCSYPKDRKIYMTENAGAKFVVCNQTSPLQSQ